MSFSFSSLIRLIAFLAIGATMFAAGVSRIEDPSSLRRTRQRPGLMHINEFYVKDRTRDPRWLDVETGRMLNMPLAAGDVLEAASCSPWRDENGQVQVIGRWTARSAAGPTATVTNFGLSRYSFPSGRLLDQVSTDIMPISPPAWYPGTRARILFPSGDGRLYHYAFESEKGDRAQASSGGTPKPIAWRCPWPGMGESFVSEVHWPTDPRLADRVFATLRIQTRDQDGLNYSRNQIWWLKLDQAGTSVVAAGRLISEDAGDHDERSATISTLPDGRPVISYLRHPEQTPGWEVRVAPVQLGSDHRTPVVRWETTRVLSAEGMASPPALSSDGRFVAAVLGTGFNSSRMERISTAPILAPEPPMLLAGPVSPGP